jgi:hypothetical protein
MCEAPDCERKVYARGLCGRHYKQWQRHGLVQPDARRRLCGRGLRAARRHAGLVPRHYLRWSRTGTCRPTCRSRGRSATCAGGGLPREAPQRWLLPDALPPAARCTATSPLGGRASGHGRRLAQPRLLDVSVPPHCATSSRRAAGASSSTGSSWPPTWAVRCRGRGRAPPQRRPPRQPAREPRAVDHAQPKGQRVEDKLAFAYELLRRYDAERCALGPRPRPDTGPRVAAEPASLE